MTSLRDIKETTDVNYKQIHDYHKKNITNTTFEIKSEIVKGVLQIKTRNRRTPISVISKNMDIPECTVRKYLKEMDQVFRRKMSTSQKNESQMRMQIGKAKARFKRNEITELELESKIEEIRSKYTESVNHNPKGGSVGIVDIVDNVDLDACKQRENKINERMKKVHNGFNANGINTVDDNEVDRVLAARQNY